jgi:hypothetical protein
MFVLQSSRSNLFLGQLAMVGGSPYVTRSTKINTLCHNDLDLVIQIPHPKIMLNRLKLNIVNDECTTTMGI